MAILDLGQIRTYYQKYWDIVTYIREINENQPDNQKFKNIQIPVNLTQSLAYHFLIENPQSINLDGIISELLKEGNNRTYDLIYETATMTTNIEVKATGTNNFQRLRKKALSADYVVWINFNALTNYDIATFKPAILNPQDRLEIEVTWDRLRTNDEVAFFMNREL